MNDKFVDEVDDLAYYGARYYDNQLMSWTQSDPKYRFAPEQAQRASPRRADLYQFTLNNPLRYLDPDGHDDAPSVTSPVPAPVEDPEVTSAINKQGEIWNDIDLVLDDKSNLHVREAYAVGDPGNTLNSAQRQDVVSYLYSLLNSSQDAVSLVEQVMAGAAGGVLTFVQSGMTATLAGQSGSFQTWFNPNNNGNAVTASGESREGWKEALFHEEVHQWDIQHKAYTPDSPNNRAEEFRAVGLEGEPTLSGFTENAYRSQLGEEPRICYFCGRDYNAVQSQSP